MKKVCDKRNKTNKNQNQFEATCEHVKYLTLQDGFHSHLVIPCAIARPFIKIHLSTTIIIKSHG
jgi:hypothetical protein